MRRPAVFISAAFGIGIFTAFHVNMGFVMLMILMTCAVAFFVWEKICCREASRNDTMIGGRHKLIKLICIFICIAAVGGFRFEYSKVNMDSAQSSFGKEMYVEGFAVEADDKEGYILLKVDGGTYDYLVRCYGEDNDTLLYVGSRVKVFGQVQEPGGKRNPSCFDYGLYLRSCGTAAIVDAKTIKEMPYGQVPLLKLTAGIRYGLSGRLSQMTNKSTKGMIMAMLFGDKSHMDEDVYEEFRKNGTAHVLAVSGLHVGVLYGFFVMLWRGRKGSLFYVIILTVLLIYSALADFSPSVVRAAVMITLHIAAKLLNRRYDLLSAAGTTFMIMLIAEPYQLFNTGFQLSFLAMASIGVILPFAENFYKGIFLVSASVQIGMMPYTAFVFNYISLSTVVVNIPVVFLVGLLQPVALCLMVSRILPEGVVELLIRTLEIGCDGMIGINQLFYADGLTFFNVVSPPVWLLAVYYGIIFMFMSEAGQLMRLRHMKKRIVIWILVIMTAAACVDFVTDNGFSMTAVTFVDVGQGDCIHIRTGEGKNYLIDGGGSKNYDVGEGILKPYFLKNGIRHIDAAFVTHLHQDHYDGIRSLAKDGMISRIGVYEGNRLMEKELELDSGAELFYLYAGQKINLGIGVFLEVMAPNRKSTSEYEEMLLKEDDENSYSLIFKLTYKGVDVLVTGDIDSDGESELIRGCGKNLKCDILKVPHHGSRHSSSEEFIQSADPSVAVFQVGKNNYGHPDDEVIAAYEQRGAQIYRNDTDGGVGIIISEKNRIKVVKMVD